MVMPHYDDAVFSLGTHLALWARKQSIHVATCFGGAPAVECSTPFDRASGFDDSSSAVRARWLENEEALNSLGITSISGGPFCDAQYDQPAEQLELTDYLHGLISMMDPRAVIGPLGLHHPDHKQLAQGLLCCDSAVWDRFVAEDLPYRVGWPFEVIPALERSNARFLVSELAHSEVKEQAVRRYGSQLWSLSLPSVSIPERLWSVD